MQLRLIPLALTLLFIGLTVEPATAGSKAFCQALFAKEPTLPQDPPPKFIKRFFSRIVGRPSLAVLRAPQVMNEVELFYNLRAQVSEGLSTRDILGAIDTAPILNSTSSLKRFNASVMNPYSKTHLARLIEAIQKNQVTDMVQFRQALLSPLANEMEFHKLDPITHIELLAALPELPLTFVEMRKLVRENPILRDQELNANQLIFELEQSVGPSTPSRAVEALLLTAMTNDFSLARLTKLLSLLKIHLGPSGNSIFSDIPPERLQTRVAHLLPHLNHHQSSEVTRLFLKALTAPVTGEDPFLNHLNQALRSEDIKIRSQNVDSISEREKVAAWLFEFYFPEGPTRQFLEESIKSLHMSQHLEADLTKKTIELIWSEKSQGRIQSVADFLRLLPRSLDHSESPLKVNLVRDQCSTSTCWLNSGVVSFESVLSKKMGVPVALSVDYLRIQYLRTLGSLEVYNLAKLETANQGGHLFYVHWLLGKFGAVPEAAWSANGKIFKHEKEILDALSPLIAEFKTGRSGPSPHLYTGEIWNQRFDEIIEKHIGLKTPKTFQFGNKTFTPMEFASQAGNSLNKFPILNKLSTDEVPHDLHLASETLPFETQSAWVKVQHRKFAKRNELAQQIVEGIDRGETPYIVYEHDGAIYNKNGLIEGTNRDNNLALHAVVAVGYVVDGTGNVILIKVQNSWGTHNGDRGYFYLPLRFLNQRLYSVESFDLSKNLWRPNNGPTRLLFFYPKMLA